MNTYPEQINTYIKQIDLYKELYGAEIDDFDISTNYAKYPHLNKELITANFPNNWMTDKLEKAILREEIELGTSSGTGGNKTQILRKKNWWQYEYEHVYITNRYLTKLQENEEKKAVLTMPCCSNTVLDISDKLLGYCERTLDNALHLNMSANPNTWHKNDIKRMARELSKFEPYYFQADPVYLVLLLKFINKFNIDIHLYQTKLLGFGYDYLTSYAKRFISQYFHGIEQINIFGTRETGLNIIESDQKIKPIPDRCIVDFELVQQDIYRCVVTSWKNEYMPLINYETGDLFRLDTNSQKPKINLSDKDESIVISQFCGRESEVTYNENNQIVTVGDIDLHLSYLKNPILIYQLCFSSSKEVQFKYITLSDDPISKQQEDDLRDTLTDLYGNNLAIDFSLEHYINPEPSGKFSIVKKINNLY